MLSKLSLDPVKSGNFCLLKTPMVRLSCDQCALKSRLWTLTFSFWGTNPGLGEQPEVLFRAKSSQPGGQVYSLAWH